MTDHRKDAETRVEVRQEDREAAADVDLAYVGHETGWSRTVRDGRWDDSRTVQAFARHAASAYQRGLADAGAENAREPYQQRVDAWMQVTFGEAISTDTTERNHRFLEEALELVQSLGCTASEAHQLVDYAFARPIGESGQEVGGVMVTLAALCNANGLLVNAEAERELAGVWTKVKVIQAKQAAKPKHSPLPATPTQERADG